MKQDLLFGKRGKNNLVLLNGSYKETHSFIAERMGTELEVSCVKGTITTFVIEEFVPHECEYFLSMQTRRNSDTISFGAWVESLLKITGSEFLPT